MLFPGPVPVPCSLLAGFVWLTAPQEQTGTLAEGSGVCTHNPLNMSLCEELHYFLNTKEESRVAATLSTFPLNYFM